LRNPFGDDQPGKVHPSLAVVEHDAVRSGDDLVGVRQDMVRIEGQLRLHFPAGGAGGFEDERLEASAVRHRFVEPPATAVHAPGLRGFPDQLQGGQRFVHLAITPVNAGNVPAAAVAARQNNPARQRAFEKRQHVVTVQPEFLSPELAGFNAELLAALRVFAGAGVTGNGHALAAGERISVARQFEGGARSVTAIEQPAQVGGGGAQRGELPGGKEPFVLGCEAPMCLMTCHGKMLTQRGRRKQILPPNRLTRLSSLITRSQPRVS
jgi:hypothetical protein